MKVSPRRARLIVWLKTLAVVAAYAVAIAVVRHFLHTRFFPSPILALVLAFALVQSTAVLYMLVRLLTKKTKAQIRLRRSERIDPWIRETLAEHALGGDQLAALNGVKGKYPENIEVCLLQSLPSIRGSGRERLSQLASDLGLLRQWKRQATAHNAEERKEAVSKLGRLSLGLADSALLKALSDSHESVRLEASRALVQSANPSIIESVFSFAITQPLIVRAVLTEDLRPHITTLASRAIPRALESSNPEHVRVIIYLPQ